MSAKKAGAAGSIAWLLLAGMVAYARHAPRFMRHWGFTLLLLLLWHGWRSRVKVAMEHLAIAFPNASEDVLKKTAYDSYMNLALFCAEFCQMAHLTKENLDAAIRINGLDRLDAARARGKGVVLAWAHYDHFEMLNYALALKGYPVYTLIREVDNPLIDRMLNAMRKASGQKIILREGASSQMIQRLREGKIVTIATDQNAMFNSVFARFFGKWAATIKSPAVVHLRTGAPILPVYTVREKDGSHTAYILPEITAAKTGDIKKDVALITQEIAKVQEEFISRRPEFWLWLHRRWKIQPDEKERAFAEGVLGRSA
ncbi:MAG: lysophospholipid acyltransferase family protein [Nitrospinae bacterium]|nr:lysophospholipid acyltransferase family protein [Nitrospinota bacterium]